MQTKDRPAAVQNRAAAIEMLTGLRGPCDGHASGAVTAIVGVLLASGGYLELCGSCARKRFGYEHLSSN